MGKDQYIFGENSLFAKSLKIASCFNNDIAKSEVGYAFSNSNPDMNSLKFPKKGADLIKMISDKKTSLQTQYDSMVLNQTGLKTKLTESGIVFSNRNGYDEATYDYNSTPSDVRDICYSFNDLRYTLKRQLDEIKTCQALIDNLEENKTYTLSTPQILSLQKAMKFDLMKGVESDIQKSEGSRGGKVIGHTKSGKPVYESTHARHDSYKNFSSKDHDDAAKIHMNSESSKMNMNERDEHSADHSRQTDSYKEDLKNRKKEARNNTVIGKTSSGKDIKHNPDHSDHSDFTHEDHKDAALKHGELADKENKDIDKLKEHADASVNHWKKHYEKGGKYKTPDSEKKYGKDSKVEKSDNNDISKAEGSRGGKIIGHTSSGKPIYESGEHIKYNVEDHKDAAEMHRRLSDKYEAEHKEGKGKDIKIGDGGSISDKRAYAAHHNTNATKHLIEADKKEQKEKDKGKHKVGDHVIDSEGKKGKVTHADGKEVAVEHDNGDVSGYEHHQVKKYSDKKESSLEDELNAAKPTGKEREVAAADDKKRAEKSKAEKEAKKKHDGDIKKSFESLGLSFSEED